MEHVLWSMKYAPKTWSDFVGQDAAVSQLKRLASSNVCPNMVFYGPYGTGKTSAAVLFAQALLGDDFDNNFKILNIRDLREFTLAKAKRPVQALAKLDRAARSDLDEYMSAVYREAKDELKTHDIRREPNKSQLLQAAIRLFASTLALTTEREKVLVLDEADALDNNMQQALRRTMEVYNRACRFILITPTVSGWSPAVLSRCLMVRFRAGSRESIESLVRRVASAEDVAVDDLAIAAIAREARGDYRRAIDLLQICATGTDRVTEDTVFECSRWRLSEAAREVVALAVRGDFVRSRDLMKHLLALEGYDPHEVLLEMAHELIVMPLDDETTRALLQRFAEIDHRMTQARNPFVHLSALIASIAARCPAPS